MEAKVSFSIGAKTAVFFTLLLAIFFGASIFTAVFYSKSSALSKATFQIESFNEQTAAAVQSTLSKYQEETTNLVNSANYLSLFSSETFDAEFLTFLESYFSLNGTVFFVYSDNFGLKINQENLTKNNETENFFARWISEKNDGIYNISNYFNQSVLCIVFTQRNASKNQKSAVAFSSRQISSFLGNGFLTASELFGSDGSLLVSSDLQKTVSEPHKEGSGLFQEILQFNSKAGTFLHTHNDTKRTLVAYHRLCTDKTSANDALSPKHYFLVSATEEGTIYSSINKSAVLSVCLGLVVLFSGLLLLKGFSRSMITKIEHLTEAAYFIEAGKFNISLPVHSKDEISVLTKAFNKMALSLEELKNSGAVAERKNLKTERPVSGSIMKIKLENFGNLQETGDSSSFRQLQEKYFSMVTESIQKSSGRTILQNEDEFLAVWNNSEFENEKEAAWNALKTAFMLRYAFFVENKERKELQKKTIRVDIGMSAGDFTITSSKFSETENTQVKGFAPIFASFAADLNRSERTDIILEESACSLVKERLIVSQISSEKTDFSGQRYYAAINATGMKGPQNMAQLIKALV